jgi:anti-anti-sigma factor
MSFEMESSIAEIHQEGGRVVVKMTEAEVRSEQLRDLVHELKLRLENQDARTFIFCFANVEFLPSACLAMLLMFHQEVKRKDGRVVLLNCQDNVEFLLRLARLDSLFELAEGDPSQVRDAG